MSMNNLITFTFFFFTTVVTVSGQKTLKHIAMVSGTQYAINKYLKNEGKWLNDSVTLKQRT